MGSSCNFPACFVQLFWHFYLDRFIRLADTNKRSTRCTFRERFVGISPQWYVVQTRPQKEPVVVGLLAQAGHQIFCPTMRRDGARAVPLFPRYCFLRTDLGDAGTHHLIRFTRGVARILGDDTGPVPVRPEFIATLQASMVTGSLVEQELLYRAGDQVRVRNGILRDLVGIIEKNCSEAGRVRILFKWLSRRMRATVHYRDIEKAA